MTTPMMQPAMWNSGVQQPNYATPLLDFSPMGKVGQTIAGQMKGPQPQGNGPMQLTPGANQGKPMSQGGIPGGMSAMASTTNAAPWASVLMKMFGGAGMQAQPSGFSMGNPGGTAGVFGGSQNTVY